MYIIVIEHTRLQGNGIVGHGILHTLHISNNINITGVYDCTWTLL